jgi:chemotaxis response regulator CheB
MFMVEKLKPTVVLMDINIPALDGIAAHVRSNRNILMSPS